MATGYAEMLKHEIEKVSPQGQTKKRNGKPGKKSYLCTLYIMVYQKDEMEFCRGFRA